MRSVLALFEPGWIGTIRLPKSNALSIFRQWKHTGATWSRVDSVPMVTTRHSSCGILSLTQIACMSVRIWHCRASRTNLSTRGTCKSCSSHAFLIGNRCTCNGLLRHGTFELPVTSTGGRLCEAMSKFTAKLVMTMSRSLHCYKKTPTATQSIVSSNCISVMDRSACVTSGTKSKEIRND